MGRRSDSTGACFEGRCCWCVVSRDECGTLNAEPRSIHNSIGINTLSSATRSNLKDCSEAVAGGNLPNAILTGCDLSGADLKGTNLFGATLTDVDLANANLTASNLGGADLNNANLAGANLAGANLRGVANWNSVHGKDPIIGLDKAINVSG